MEEIREDQPPAELPYAVQIVRAARARLQAKDIRGAVALLKSAIAKGEQTGEMMELVGVAHGMMGNTSSARAAFAEATRLEPGRASSHYNYAIVLKRDGDLEMAAEEVNTALYINPKHAGAAELRDQLAQLIRDRKHIGEVAFRTIGREESQAAIENTSVTQLLCPVCGKSNRFTARVCRHCGTFIQEMPDLIPVE